MPYISHSSFVFVNDVQLKAKQNTGDCIFVTALRKSPVPWENKQPPHVVDPCIGLVTLHAYYIFRVYIHA